MKVIILAGGFGTRLSEMTQKLPKPMVQIGGVPILLHIMKIYANFGFKDFIIALGYKSDYVKNYFSKLPIINSDFTINLASGRMDTIKKPKLDWNVTLVDTGLNTMTGGRIKRLSKIIGDEDFLLTYGDGVADVNIEKTIALHKQSNRILTMTAVRPTARFGELDIEDNLVINFQEKPQMDQGWINGGFFVCKSKVFDYIKGDEEMLEREPMQRILEKEGISVYKHDGFWHCMDSKRDHDKLNKLWNDGKAPWVL